MDFFECYETCLMTKGSSEECDIDYETFAFVAKDDLITCF